MRKRWCVVAGVALASLPLAACGGDDSNGRSAPTGAPVTTTATRTATTIKATTTLPPVVAPSNGRYKTVPDWWHAYDEQWGQIQSLMTEIEPDAQAGDWDGIASKSGTAAEMLTIMVATVPTAAQDGLSTQIYVRGCITAMQNLATAAENRDEVGLVTASTQMSTCGQNLATVPR